VGRQPLYDATEILKRANWHPVIAEEDVEALIATRRCAAASARAKRTKLRIAAIATECGSHKAHPRVVP
jgi:hypothetical protein